MERELDSRNASRNELKTLLRFMTVGVGSTLVDFGIFTLLHVLAGIPTLPANIISYSCGIVNSFVFNRRWTFAERRQKSAQRQFIQFVGVSLSALVVNTCVVQALAPQFSLMINNAATGALLAKVCATGIGMCWNFIANSMWTFRNAKSAETDSQ